MSSFIECIEGHIAAERLTKKVGQELIDQFNALHQKRVDAGNPDPQGSAVRFMNIVLDRILQERRAQVIHVNRAKELVDQVDEAFKAWESDYNSLNKAQRGLEYLIGLKPNRSALYNEILTRADLRGDVIMAEMMEPLAKVFEKYHLKWNGKSSGEQVESFKNIIRHLEDGKATAETQEFVAAMREVNDLMVRRMRSMGAVMGKNQNYFPHTHNGIAIRKLHPDLDEARAIWKSEITPLLDLNKMLDNETGLPLSNDQLGKILDDMFEDLVDGNITPNGIGKGDKFKRRAKARVLQFKSGDAFLEYNAKYGVGDEGLISAYFDHVALMSRDIGIMEVMGPKPNALHATIQKHHIGKDSRGRQDFNQAMFNTLIGPTMKGADPDWYRYVEGGKFWLRASLLDTAGITALSDGFFVKMSAEMNGMSGTKAMAQWGSNVIGADKRGQQFAARGHHIANMMSTNSLSMHRLTEGQGMVGGIPQQAANFVHVFSGLRHITEAGANAMSMSFMGDLAVYATTGARMADMPRQFSDLLRRSGISDAEWDIVRQVSPGRMSEDAAATFMRPIDIAQASIEGVDPKRLKEIARKVGDAEVSLRYIATNAPQLKARAISTWGQEPTTWLRAAWSAAFMFKSFPISVFFNHFRPFLQAAIRMEGHALNYAANMATFGLMLGGTALQLKELSKGRDMRDIDGRFVMDAMLISGAGGFVSDFMFQDHATFGQSVETFLLGPIYSGAAGSIRTLNGSWQKALFNEDYEFAERALPDTARFMRKYIPGADLPYWQFVTERSILDNVERAMGEDVFDERMRRHERDLRRKRGQDYWWQPTGGPVRLPEGPEFTFGE